MSARHRALLAAKKNAQKGEDISHTVISDDEGEERSSKIDNSFLAFNSSEEDGSDDGSCDSYHDHNTFDKKMFAEADNNAKKAAELDLDDMSYLESVIDCNGQPTNEQNPKCENIAKDEFLAVNMRMLNVDDVMRRRFGSRNVGALEDEVGKEGKKKRSQRPRGQRPQQVRVRNKHHLFGSPKEDWPRHVTYVCGGISMHETSPPPSVATTSPIPTTTTCRWFKYQWSEEYCRLQEAFEIVQNTGDANMLAMFVSRHPHHLEALLQLGMLFAHTGHMDRAADLVRRCIYYMECAHVDSFQPFVSTDCDQEAGRKAEQSRCRMDCDCKENRLFFSALFRHIQMVSMIGCPSVAADIGRCLLSVLPERDPMCMLLYIDHFLLVAGRGEEVRSFCSFDAAQVLTLPCRAPAADPESHSSPDADPATDCPAALLHELLPNWAFSLSLSSFMQENCSTPVNAVWRGTARKLRGEEVPSVERESARLLRTSLRRFPYMLGVVVSTSSHVPQAATAGHSGNGRWHFGGGVRGPEGVINSWKLILDHPFFRHFSGRSR